VHGSFDIIHLPTQISSHFFEKIRLPDHGKSCNLEKIRIGQKITFELKKKLINPKDKKLLIKG
jgi:hypothetical protein